jgi:hypothetical protein
VPRVLAVLKPPKSHPKFLFYAKHIAESVAKSPYFPPPFAPLAPLEADIAALEAAMVVAVTRAKGAADTRDAARYKVKCDLDVIVSRVQAVANPYPPEQAEEVIVSAGLAVKKVSGPGPRDEFQAQHGDHSGEVWLRRKAAPGTASYEWEYSIDGKTWISVTPHVRADVTIGGLTPGVTYFFRSRCTTKDGPGNWSQVIKLMVV